MKFVAISKIQYRCKQCEKLFVNKLNLSRHNLHAHIATKTYSCVKCNKTFHRNNNKIQHERNCNNIQYQLKRKLITHTESNKRLKCDELEHMKSKYNIRVTKTAFKNAVISGRDSYLAGRMKKNYFAKPSSPQDGLI